MSTSLSSHAFGIKGSEHIRTDSRERKTVFTVRLPKSSQRDLKRRFGKPRLKDLQRIAIDEIAVVKGHRYRTLSIPEPWFSWAKTKAPMP